MSVETLNVAETSPALVNAWMYAVGEKYGVWGLKTLSKKKFKGSVDSSWKDENFLLVVCQVYKSTLEEDQGLRQMVVEVIYRNIQVLRDRGDFGTVLREVYAFTFNLLFKVIKSNLNICYVCGKSINNPWTVDCLSYPDATTWAEKTVGRAIA